MFCCSPDVGDCQKCKPHLWATTNKSYIHWKPKLSKNRKTRRKRVYIKHK